VSGSSVVHECRGLHSRKPAVSGDIIDPVTSEALTIIRLLSAAVAP
jgi:hypothetical protein